MNAGKPVDIHLLVYRAARRGQSSGNFDTTRPAGMVPAQVSSHWNQNASHMLRYTPIIA